MIKTFTRFAAVAAVSFSSLAQAQVEYVDPAMGGQGFMLEPTRPTVSLPNSMVRVYPVRKDQLDDEIRSFPLTIISHRLGELFSIMPGSESPAAYDQETETPYYYSTRFDDSLIQTEFTPTERCGYFRFTFPSGKAVVSLANRFKGTLTAGEGNSISGSEQFNGESRISSGAMQAFVYGEFSAPIKIESHDTRPRQAAGHLVPKRSKSFGIPLRHFLHQRRAGQEKFARRNFLVGFR